MFACAVTFCHSHIHSTWGGMGSFNPVGIIARMGVISLMGITKSIPLPLRIAFTREVHHSNCNHYSMEVKDETVIGLEQDLETPKTYLSIISLTA